MVDVEVAPWLRSLPLAPVFHPSEEEFDDPIAYILRIEKEASEYGICKIVPPFSRAPNEVVLSNLNHSLALSQDAHAPPLSRSMCGSASAADARVVMSLDFGSRTDSAKFATRRQQLGWNPRRSKGGSQYRAQKLVWESGEYYTLDEFQEKAKSFSSTILGTCQEVSPLVVESIYWNADSEKPISIEYANDIPGSAFQPFEIDRVGGNVSLESDVVTPIYSGSRLANSRWNIRTIARSQGSLLKFMPDEVPGVTSPMVYLGMLFSWFAWHVEDHELHSLNYLHMGAPKTWYAVPSSAASALEEVIRLYGYGSRLNQKAAFTLLGEKTTVLSPEFLVAAGVPCCRLVQYPGEYVVTFPRAYHLGFSHGFNCGEAANFATPAWLEVARKAAARRASMSHLPMLSHEQLLYLLTMSLPARIHSSPRVSWDCHVEKVVKTAFVNEVKYSNSLVAKLMEFGLEGCVLLSDCRHPLQYSSVIADEGFEVRKEAVFYGSNGNGGEVVRGCSEAGYVPLSGVTDAINPACVQSRAFSPDSYDSLSDESSIAPLPTPWGALPCATCGILCFAAMAVVQPTVQSSRLKKSKARILQSGKALDTVESLSQIVERNQESCKVKDASSDKMLEVSSRISGFCRLNSALVETEEEKTPDFDSSDEMNHSSENSDEQHMGQEKVLADSEGSSQPTVRDELNSSLSALEVLAEMYKDESDTDCDELDYETYDGLEVRPDGVLFCTDDIGICVDAPWQVLGNKPQPQELQERRVIEVDYGSALSKVFVSEGSNIEAKYEIALETTTILEHVFSCTDSGQVRERNNRVAAVDNTDSGSGNEAQRCDVNAEGDSRPSTDADDEMPKSSSWCLSKGSWKPHVFCLEHALESLNKLQSVGGAAVLIICHSNLEIIQQRAEDLACDLAIEHKWTNISLREASSEELEVIGMAIGLQPESVQSYTSWMTRFGLSNQQTMYRPKNTASEIMDAACEIEEDACEVNINDGRKLAGGMELGLQRCIGRWCGREWEASQIHPLLGGSRRILESLPEMLKRGQTGKLQNLLQHSKMFRNTSDWKRPSFLFENSLKGKKNSAAKDNWDAADIVRNSKRNAILKNVRKQDEVKRGKPIMASPVRHDDHGKVILCAQATECVRTVIGDNTKLQDASKAVIVDVDAGCQTSFSVFPLTFSVETANDPVKTTECIWHEVPVACSSSLRPQMSSLQCYSEWSTATGLCSTSQQDITSFDELGQDSNAGSALVIRLKRNAKGILKVQPKEAECMQNEKTDTSDVHFNDVTVQETVGGNTMSGEVSDDVDRTDDDDDYNSDESDEGESNSSDTPSSPEHSQKTISVPVGSSQQLPFFTLSRKRSCNKSRKRAKWETLLNKVTVSAPHIQMQEQDAVPDSCITDAEFSKNWARFVGEPYRTKLRPRSCNSVQSEDSLKETETTKKQQQPQQFKRRKNKVTVKKNKNNDTEEEAEAEAEAEDEGVIGNVNNPYECDIEGCTMSFVTEYELGQHKRNKCTFKGCGKRLFSHKYLLQHRKVHMDDRPLKCSWPGCPMSFKWAWARTEHLRVHTGERPYACPECDKTFRFVSDFSRHKRRTGHARS